MNDLLHGKTVENITLADIDSVIREGRRLRSEEIHRLWGCFNALVRKEFMAIGRFGKSAGKWLAARMEAMTLRQQQTRVHYD